MIEKPIHQPFVTAAQIIVDWERRFGPSLDEVQKVTLAFDIAHAIKKGIGEAMRELTSEQMTSLVTWAGMACLEAGLRGRPLTKAERKWAKESEVEKPGLVRVCIVSKMPEVPEDLKELAKKYLDPANAGGMTLGYVILVLNESLSERLLRHELRHVHQSEGHKTIRAYLEEYVKQVLEHGYYDAPWEQDARAHEGEQEHGPFKGLQTGI